MTSTPILISSVPEWKLLQAVSPIFCSPDLIWEPLSVDNFSIATTKIWTKLFGIHIKEILLYVSPEKELSHPQSEQFSLIASNILTTMEKTVDPDIPKTFANDNSLDQDSIYNCKQLERAWPGLLYIVYLQENGQEWTSSLVLKQNPPVFNELQGVAGVMVDFLKNVCGDVVQTIKPSGMPLESRNRQRWDYRAQLGEPDDGAQVRDRFYTYSQRLFTGIVHKLAICQRPHEALLHLKGPSDAHDSKDIPKLTMFLAFCPKRDTWQQLVCSKHVDSTKYNVIDNICKMAQDYSRKDCILGVELEGDALLDTSENSIDEKLSHLDTSVTLDKLFRDRIFHQDTYKVFPNDKKILAYVLARALLCLYGGPWLQMPWSADKLIFRYDAAEQTICDVYQPYILCDLLQELAPPVTGTLDKPPPLLAFAKILVDLDQGCAGDTGDATESEVFKSVKKYYTERRDNYLSPGYAHALYSSIFFNKYFKEFQRENRNATIRDAILEGIVKPLEKDVHMDRRDQWGCRNVKWKNNTSVTAPLIVPGVSSGMQHPRTALSSG